MNWARAIIATGVILFAASCVRSEPDNHPIRPGIFYSEDGVEQIAVGEKAIYFMIRRHVYDEDKWRPGRVSPYIAFYPAMYLDRAREYTVEEDGEIRLYLNYSTDPFLFFRLYWHKNSEKIEITDPATGQAVWFIRAGCEGGDKPCTEHSGQ